MQGQQQSLKEDEAEAAFIDSFFLPGGILDPGEDNVTNNNQRQNDATGNIISDDEIDGDTNTIGTVAAVGSKKNNNNLSPFSTPSRPPQQRELSSPLPGGLSDILNINPWEVDDALDQPILTNNEKSTTVIPFINTAGASSEGEGGSSTHSLLLDPITTALNSTTSSTTYSIPSSPSPLSTLHNQQPSSQEDQNGIALVGAGTSPSPSTANSLLPPPISLLPPGFDNSSSPGGSSSIMTLGNNSQQQQQQSQPLNSESNRASVPSVFDFETPDSPPFSTPPRASPAEERVVGGEGTTTSSTPGKKKSWAKVASDARRKKNSAAVTPSRGSSNNNASAATVKRTSLQATSPAGGSITSSGSPAHHNRRRSDEDGAVSPIKGAKGKSAAHSTVSGTGRRGDGKSTQRGDEKQYAGHNKAVHEEEGSDGWTHHRKHYQGESKDFQDFSFNSNNSSTGRIATSSTQPAHAAKQKQKHTTAGQRASNNNKSKQYGDSNRHNKETGTSTKRPLGVGGNSNSSSDSQSSPSSTPPSFLDTIGQVFQIAVGVSQAILPLIRQSIMFIAYFFTAAAKGLILLALGLANTFRYAVEEVEQVDGAFLCYLVLYLVPHICDVLMTCFSLPHFTPHFISAISVYQLCSESSTKLSLSSMSSSPSSPRRGGKRPSKQGPSHSSDSKSHELCRLVLWWCRSLLPFNLIMEGFSEPNLSFMMLHDWTRLLLAFVLSLVRANLILSPVAWLSWSFQVFIIVYLPPNFMNGCFLLMMGLASVRLCTVIQQFDISTEASYGSTNGKHHKE